jgi:hypothetical protein
MSLEEMWVVGLLLCYAIGFVAQGMSDEEGTCSVLITWALVGMFWPGLLLLAPIGGVCWLLFKVGRMLRNWYTVCDYR